MKQKSWFVKRDEIQVSHDIINLYPSLLINKAFDVLIDQLNNDKDDLIERTKLCLKDIYELDELCLSKCYFYGTIKLEYRNILELLHYFLWF